MILHIYLIFLDYIGYFNTAFNIHITPYFVNVHTLNLIKINIYLIALIVQVDPHSFNTLTDENPADLRHFISCSTVSGVS